MPVTLNKTHSVLSDVSLNHRPTAKRQQSNKKGFFHSVLIGLITLLCHPILYYSATLRATLRFFAHIKLRSRAWSVIPFVVFSEWLCHVRSSVIHYSDTFAIITGLNLLPVTKQYLCTFSITVCETTVPFKWIQTSTTNTPASYP